MRGQKFISCVDSIKFFRCARWNFLLSPLSTTPVPSSLYPALLCIVSFPASFSFLFFFLLSPSDCIAFFTVLPTLWLVLKVTALPGTLFHLLRVQIVSYNLYVCVCVP